MPLLDLTEREDQGPVPAGKYHAKVEDAEERKTGDKGKLPEGTPMIWMRFSIIEPIGFEPTEVGEDGIEKPVNTEGRGVFHQIVIPPQEINGQPYKNYKMMNGILFRSLLALGYTRDELESGDFDLDYNDLKGRESVLTVGRREYNDPDTDEVIYSNTVKG